MSSNYFVFHRIMITGKYLLSKQNIMADCESRNVEGSSRWKFSPAVFKQITKAYGTPDMNLFASRMSHRVATYMSWKPELFRKQQIDFNKICYIQILSLHSL